jgi:hypothetical protein
VNVRQRQPRIEDAAHLAYVRTLPCLICGKPGSDPAHLRTASREYGKRETGMQEKPSDCWVLPLCRFHHSEQHSGNELAWWASYGIPDPFAKAVELYASRPGASKPPQERRRRKPKPTVRKPRGERRQVPKGKPLESRPTDWPKNRKIPSRPKERSPA